MLKTKFLDWYLKIGVASALVGASMEFFMVKTGFCVRNFLSHSLNTLCHLCIFLCFPFHVLIDTDFKNRLCLGVWRGAFGGWEV